jgi:hypothetical protein
LILQTHHYTFVQVLSLTKCQNGVQILRPRRIIDKPPWRYIFRDMNKGPKIRSPSVGDTVTFQFGAHTARGKVIEDRGNVGYLGRRILLVSIGEKLDGRPTQFEIPADEVQVLDS